MPETNEALTGPEAAAQVPSRMLAELIAGDTEVSASEPVSEAVSEAPKDTQQAEEVEASGQQASESEESSTQTGDDESKDDNSGPDLEWIDERDAEYADHLSTRFAEGKIDEKDLEFFKAKYMPLKGFYAKSNEFAKLTKELEADAEKWRDTGAKLFETEEAREDFIRWRESRGQEKPTPEAGPVPQIDLAPYVKRIQEAETEEDQLKAIADLSMATSTAAAQAERNRDQQQATAAEQAQAEYAENLEGWAQDVSKQFTDLEGATQDDFVAAADQLAAAIKRRGQVAPDVIRSAEDLRDEIRPYLEPIVLKRKMDELLGKQDARSKQYDGKTLKASSAPGTSAKPVEDLSTFAGRTKAISEDPDIQRLMEQAKGL